MLKRVFGNLYFLTFLNGFLLASLFYFNMEANFEQEVFQAIHADINTKLHPGDSEDSVVVKVMHTTHNLMVNREPVFARQAFTGIKSSIIGPTSIDLMTGKGACGSFSMVLARVLQAYRFDVRIAQMKAYGAFAGHNIVEARTSHGWVVMDPLLDVYFINPSGKMASFAEVQHDWNHYSRQVPAGYDMNYRYEDVRYANWTKIPVFLPAVKKMLDFTLGKTAADSFSMRTYFLRKYTLCFNIVLSIFILVLAFTIFRLIKAKVFPRPNIPVTFANLYKYIWLRIAPKKFSEQGHA